MMTIKKRLIAVIFLFYVCCVLLTLSHAQNTEPEAALVNPQSTLAWIGNYGTFRISEKFYWHAELHYRRRDNDRTLFYGDMAQIYNRHGIKYVPTKNFSATFGGVLRLDFNPGAEEGFDSMILEPRLWHEYIWTMPFEHLRIYHRLRFEHRWNRGFENNSAWQFRNRWRYKFLMKIPLNKPKLQPGAFYFSPDVELIMQSGKSVTDNALEDLRIFPTFAYIANPRVTYSAGLMYTTGQTTEAGYVYRERWIARFNVYFNFDFRKNTQKIPETNFYD